MQRLRNLLPTEDGQGLAEYALILALIAIVAIVALLFLGDRSARSCSGSVARSDRWLGPRRPEGRRGRHNPEGACNDCGTC